MYACFSIDNIENQKYFHLWYSLSYPKLLLQNSIDNIEIPSNYAKWAINKERTWASGQRKRQLENQKLMFSTTNYMSIAKCCKDQINGLYLLCKSRVYITCGGDDFVLASSLLPHWGRKFS